MRGSRSVFLVERGPAGPRALGVALPPLRPNEPGKPPGFILLCRRFMARVQESPRGDRARHSRYRAHACRGRTYGEDLPVNRLRMNSRGPWRYHRIHNHAKTDRSAQEAILVRTTGKAPQWPKKPSP